MIVLFSEDGECCKGDIVLCRRRKLKSNDNEVLDGMSLSHRANESLCYTILFPDTRDGWNLKRGISEDSAVMWKKITSTMLYTCYFSGTRRAKLSIFFG